jgi:hypothetical protein
VLSLTDDVAARFEAGADTKATDKRILKLLDKLPPEGFARWTGPLLAGALGEWLIVERDARTPRMGMISGWG